MEYKKIRFFIDLIKNNDLFAKSPHTYITNISFLKNKDVDAISYSNEINQDARFKNKTPKTCSEVAIAFGYMAYENYLRKNNYVDFDDMLFLTYRELKKDKNAKYLNILRDTIRHIMIDEAQDLNYLQYKLIELISGDNKNIMLILDDFQAIYGWRGSSINLLFDFMEQRKPQIINITRNYRCPPSVVESSNKLIKFNKKQIDKALVAEKSSDHQPVIIISEDPENEADNVINHIENVLMDGYEFSDICILYRTNAQSRALVDRFIMNEIPHTVKSEFSFYDRSDVRDIVAYLRIIVDPENAEPQDFMRIINKPLRYLPNTLISAIERLEDDLNAVNFLSAFKKYDQANIRLNWNQRKELDSLIKKIADLQVDYTYQNLSTPDLIIKIVQIFEYEKTLNEKKPLEGDEDGKLNIEAIISGAKMFPDPLKFLGFVDSQSSKKKKKVDKNSISLMTIHASKGMEFPVVIVIGFCSKIMPYYRSTSPEEVEEERRLAYVAVTRTQERLYLSTIYGKFGRMNVVPSNYVAEMGLKLPSVIMKYGE
jgi:DNA helicase-2/ATP-dependent DNA helicase PcrA